MFQARQTMCKDQIKLKNNTQHCSPVPSMGNTSQILVINVNMSCPRKREKLARKTVGSINRYFTWISGVWNQLKILIYEWLTNPVGIQNWFSKQNLYPKALRSFHYMWTSFPEIV